jgi:hypothetical protein
MADVRFNDLLKAAVIVDGSALACICTANFSNHVIPLPPFVVGAGYVLLSLNLYHHLVLNLLDPGRRSAGTAIIIVSAKLAALIGLLIFLSLLSGVSLAMGFLGVMTIIPISILAMFVRRL